MYCRKFANRVVFTNEKIRDCNWKPRSYTFIEAGNVSTAKSVSAIHWMGLNRSRKWINLTTLAPSTKPHIRMVFKCSKCTHKIIQWISLNRFHRLAKWELVKFCFLNTKMRVCGNEHQSHCMVKAVAVYQLIFRPFSHLCLLKEQKDLNVCRHFLQVAEYFALLWWSMCNMYAHLLFRTSVHCKDSIGRRLVQDFFGVNWN